MSGAITPKVYTGMTVAPDGVYVSLGSNIQNLTVQDISATTGTFGSFTAGTLTVSVFNTNTLTSTGQMLFIAAGQPSLILNNATATVQNLYGSLAVFNTVQATTLTGSLASSNISASGTPSSVTFLRGDGTWATPASAGGTVTSVVAGTGLSGGTITGAGTISLINPVSVALGGTGLSTLSGTTAAVYSTGTATMVSGTLPVAAGGTGAVTLPLGSVVIGQGGSPVTTIAPGAAGNVLQSNGLNWTAAPLNSTGFLNIATITASGTTTIPAAICEITVLGGGGGASGAFDGTTFANGGAGGGSGGTAWKVLTGLSGNLVVTVGAGGSGGVAGGNGTNGGTTTAVVSGNTLTATGGGAANAVAGGTAGTATGGSLNLVGNPGNNAVYTLGVPGAGGAGFFGGAGRGGTPNVNSNGGAGQNWGSGGGGGGTGAGLGSSNGGAGVAGAVIIRY